VTATYTCGAGLFAQSISASTGCGGSNRINQGVTASTTCGGSDRMYTITGTTTACGAGNLVNQNMYGINSCQQNQTVTAPSRW
jgi:hypothetical protein